MLVRNIPDATVHSNTSPHHIALTVAGILDQPLPAYAYFDRVQGWLKQPLTIRQQAELRQYCPNLHVLNAVAKFDHRYRQRLQLPQPSAAAVELLIDCTDDDMLVNYNEIVLDLLPPNWWTLDSLFEVFCNGFWQPWNRGKERQWYPVGFSTRPFQRGQSKRGHWFHPYGDEPCRINDHPYCLHMQGRVQGAQFVRRVLRIKRPSDLLRFNFIGYWRKWLRLYEVDYERLGRFDDNRRHGSRRSKPELAQWGGITHNLDRRGAMCCIG